MGFVKTMPILRMFDETKAKEFYVGFLGDPFGNKLVFANRA
jgi:glyoxalase superfamily protein